MRIPPGLRLFRRAAALRQALAGRRGGLGLVPTMGALHAGHLSLVRASQRQQALTVVSIFVNPTQFPQAADLRRYPRTLAADLACLAPEGPLWVYAPAVADVYPRGFVSGVTVGGSLGRVLEARWRPGHFEGVATVVARLFGLLRPDRAYFGLKDYQQYQVIRRVTADLALPVALTGCPTVREADGLAMSSRNRFLSPTQRRAALALVRALRAAAAACQAGERSGKRLQAVGLRELRREPGLVVEYFSVADPDSLEPLARVAGRAQALTACRLGKTRLIDNLALRA